MAAPRTSVTRSFRHGERTIVFELVRSDRRTLGLTVGRDGSVVARAPRRAREADVLRWVAGHAEWIMRRRRDAAERARLRPPRRFVDGESHLYLGREHRLTVERGADAEGAHEDPTAQGGALVARTTGRVRFDGREFRVRLGPDAPPQHVAELMDAWYLRRARAVLAERLDACWASFPGDGRPCPALRVKRMRSRWGSMSPKGRMSAGEEYAGLPISWLLGSGKYDRVYSRQVSGG